MTLQLPVLLLAILSALSVRPVSAVASDDQLLHLDPEMPSSELQVLLTLQRARARNSGLRVHADALDAVLHAGKRNLEWITAINQTRAPSRQLLLSSPETQLGFPVEAPSVSNRSIVLEKFSSLKQEMPAAMLTVLSGNGAYPTAPPLSDEAFIELARRMDRIYSGASRWLLQEPSLWRYRSLAWKDIRGHYFLSRTPGLQAKLAHFKELDAETQENFRNWLVGICMNSRAGRAVCLERFTAALEASGDLTAYYSQYREQGRKVHDTFFDIQNPRKDAKWESSGQERFTLPFENPGSEEIRTFLMNIEDEWKWDRWQLKLNFVTGSIFGKTAHLVFKPGATAHVNGLGGSTITMDSNRPLTDYTARWTIRHEFGHVLGFPDCYHEFYDEAEQAMINYQLDVSNLMCSRKGKLQEKHYLEMKRIYANSLNPFNQLGQSNESSSAVDRNRQVL